MPSLLHHLRNRIKKHHVQKPCTPVKKFPLFSVQLGTDGVDETFDIQCNLSGCTIAAFTFWDDGENSRQRAEQLAASLDSLYRHGHLYQEGFMESHRVLSRISTQSN